MNQLDLSSYRNKQNGDTLSAQTWNTCLGTIEENVNQVLGDKIGPIDTTSDYVGIDIYDNGKSLVISADDFPVSVVTTNSAPQGSTVYHAPASSTLNNVNIVSISKLTDYIKNSEERVQFTRDLSMLLNNKLDSVAILSTDTSSAYTVTRPTIENVKEAYPLVDSTGWNRYIIGDASDSATINTDSEDEGYNFNIKLFLGENGQNIELHSSAHTIIDSAASLMVTCGSGADIEGENGVTLSSIHYEDGDKQTDESIVVGSGDITLTVGEDSLNVSDLITWLKTNSNIFD